ncbi:MAG: hypothetical protein K0S44_1738 [Bacteroidetes bacterium]|nr:hypothetical protein [Bacteroidota bacterium]
MVSGTSKLGTMVLVTDYGKLEIPVKNVTSLDIGISGNKAGSDKINNLLKQLSNTKEELRKSAYDELMSSDIKTIPVISEFINNLKYEPSTFNDYTPESVLSELQSRYNVTEGYSSKDVIAIDYEYSIGGTYDFVKIDLKTEYGTLSIPKEKIKRIDVMYSGGGEGGEITFKLLGTKHISANLNGGWLKTGIMVKSGQKININANGEVTFASLSGSKYKPDGSVAGVTTNALGTDYSGDYLSGLTYPTYGNVVFKIGENSTQVLKAGAKYNGTAPSQGMLYLSIYETVYNAANTGSYTVKVSVK